MTDEVIPMYSESLAKIGLKDGILYTGAFEAETEDQTFIGVHVDEESLKQSSHELLYELLTYSKATMNPILLSRIERVLGIFDSTSVRKSYKVTSSHNVRESSLIEKSTNIAKSTLVNNSQNVKNSYNVSQSENVRECSSITDCDAVFDCSDSMEVSSSVSVVDSSRVYLSQGIKSSENVLLSHNLDHASQEGYATICNKQIRMDTREFTQLAETVLDMLEPFAKEVDSKTSSKLFLMSTYSEVPSFVWKQIVNLIPQASEDILYSLFLCPAILDQTG